MARALKKALPISLEDGIEHFSEWKKPDNCPGFVQILEEKQAEMVARTQTQNAYYTDGSRVEDAHVGVGPAWKTSRMNDDEWKTKAGI